MANSNYVISSQFDDVSEIVDTGTARRISGVNGAPIGSAIVGLNAFDLIWGVATGAPNGEFYVFSSASADNNGLVDSGLVRLIAQ